ncbi:MAG: DUF5797 family protein [Haloarculaceae archaeon]
MTLSEEAQARLAAVVELQPTKNAALQDRWDMDSGSEVHRYLEDELKEYYYRNEDSLICATPKAEALVEGTEAPSETVVRTSPLQRAVIESLPGPRADPQSVVATLHAVDAEGVDTDVDAVRSALHSLVDRGVVERVRTTVPTFRLAVARSDLEVEEAPA